MAVTVKITEQQLRMVIHAARLALGNKDTRAALEQGVGPGDVDAVFTGLTAMDNAYDASLQSLGMARHDK